MQKITALENDKRIDKYLSEELKVSRSVVEKMIHQGIILLNGKIVKSSTKVNIGDVIEITKEYNDEVDLNPEDIPLDIVYEDKDVILINKPSGMVVHPGAGNRDKTMVNALLHYTNSLSNCNGFARPGIVHRIDKDTSGLILVAKNNKSHALLAEDFKNKCVKRKYIALVCGVLPHNHVIIDAPIGRDLKNRKKMTIREDGKQAITHVDVLKRYQDYTLISCTLETGRTHQIRVHLAYIGYPLYNDPVYNKQASTSFGQFLHSSEITFVSPMTKEVIHQSVPLPKPFQEFIDKLELPENQDKKENLK